MTQVIFNQKKRTAISGLDWSVLQHYQASNSVTAEVHAIAKDHAADRILIHAANVDGTVVATVGTASIGEIDDPIGREQHALAALFARSHPENANMILAWCLEATAVVVVVQNGLPVVDMVKPISDVSEMLEKVLAGAFGCYGHAIYSNDTGIHAFAELIGETELWVAAGKATRLGKIPLKKSAIIGVIVSSAILAGGFFYYKQVQSNNKLASAQAALDSENPVPAYQAALAENIGHLGFDRASIKDTLQQLEHYTVWDQGWMLRKIECDRARCTSYWDRKGGTSKSIIAARQQESYLSESSDEVSVFVWKSKLKLSGYSTMHSLEPEAKAKADTLNAYQVWRDAGIFVDEQMKEFAVWPKPPGGNASLLPRAGSVLARPISVTAPYPFAEDLINETPASVWWQSFTILYTPGSKSDQLKITLKGTTYVR